MRNDRAGKSASTNVGNNMHMLKAQLLKVDPFHSLLESNCFKKGEA